METALIEAIDRRLRELRSEINKLEGRQSVLDLRRAPGASPRSSSPSSSRRTAVS
jgi:hypothetical protein